MRWAAAAAGAAIINALALIQRCTDPSGDCSRSRPIAGSLAGCLCGGCAVRSAASNATMADWDDDDDWDDELVQQMDAVVANVQQQRVSLSLVPSAPLLRVFVLWH